MKDVRPPLTLVHIGWLRKQARRLDRSIDFARRQGRKTAGLNAEYRIVREIIAYLEESGANP